MESKGRDFRGTRHKGTTSATGRSTITGRSRQNGWNLDTLPPLPPFFSFFTFRQALRLSSVLAFLLFFFFSLYPFSRRLWLQRFFAILGVALLHPSSALGGPFSGFLFFCYWFSVLCRRLVLLLAPLRFSSPSPTPPPHASIREGCGAGFFSLTCTLRLFVAMAFVSVLPKKDISRSRGQITGFYCFMFLCYL